MYSVVVSDKTKLNENYSDIRHTYKSRLQAHYAIEEMVDDFLRSKEGNKPFKLYREPSHPDSRSWNNMPMGFFKTKDNKSFYKINIWEKVPVIGTLWNTTKVKHVISFDICYMISDPKENEVEETFVNEEVEDYFSTEVLPRIKYKDDSESC